MFLTVLPVREVRMPVRRSRPFQPISATSDNVSYVRLLTPDFPGVHVFGAETPLPTSGNHAPQASTLSMEVDLRKSSRLWTHPGPLLPRVKNRILPPGPRPKSPRRTNCSVALSP